VITQFDLPRPDSQPHDAAVAPDGTIWYQDFGQPYIGHLDPATGAVKEWKVPWVKPYPPYPPGGLDVQIGPDGNPYFAIQRGGHLMKFDRRTEEMTFWSPEQGPDLRETVAMIAITPSTNTVWFSRASSKIFGLDLRTNRVSKSYAVPGGYYGIAPVPNGNIMFFQMGSGQIGELDTQTGAATRYPTPTPDSGPRRGKLDAQGRVWFAEYYAGKIGMFDRTTRQFREWPMGAPYADPYDVVPTESGEVWAGGMVTDYVFRLNPASGQVTKYLLPSVNTNIRRIDAQSTPHGAVIWIGENHHGKITRIEVRNR
jgi:virginiamycin B lyase